MADLVAGDDGLEVDLGVPRQVGGGVPLAGLALLVQLAQLRAGQRVVPREQGVGVVLDGVEDLVDVGVGDRQDRLEVVELGAADDLVVVAVGDGHGGRSLAGGRVERMQERGEEGAGGRLVAEVDGVARGEEVGDVEPGQHVDDGAGLAGGRGTARRAGRGTRWRSG